MILIADAGGTKIEWALIDSDGTTLLRTSTRGHNAAHADTQTLVDMLHDEAPALYAEAQGVDEIFYYGAGCAGLCLRFFMRRHVMPKVICLGQHKPFAVETKE